MNAPRTVRCPACGAPSVFAASNRFRPFCSERCRGIDLGAWADERYRVGSPIVVDDEETGAPAAPDVPPH